jgi:hypothetical protein
MPQKSTDGYDCGGGDISNVVNINGLPYTGAQSGGVQTVVWFHLLPQPASSGSPSDASEGGASFASKARFLFNFDRLNLSGTTLSGKLYARGRTPSGNSDIRLYNVTDAVELGIINYTETVDTSKSTNLSSLPTSGLKLVEVQMRRTSGASNFIIVSSSCDFILTS